MKKQNGITLVALIITIIVMVILAGVIISSAVADGGIIDRAESAMKEKERAEAEELIIASYVYKTTASTSTIAVLNLDATADAIYENLTTNGFILIGVSSGDDLYTGGDEINLNIQGKQGNYTGTVTDKGLEEGLKENNDVIVGDTSDTSGKKEELGDKSIEELLSLYANNNDESAKNELMKRGVDFGSVIFINDSGYNNYYMYIKNNLDILILLDEDNEENATFTIVDNSVIPVLSDLYEIALIANEEVKTKTECCEEFIIQYKNEKIEGEWHAYPWDFTYKGYMIQCTDDAGYGTVNLSEIDISKVKYIGI